MASNAGWSSGSSQQAAICRSMTSYKPTVDQRWSTSRIVANPSVNAANRSPSPTKNVSSFHLKRVSGEVSSSSEVTEHLFETTVRPGDAIVAGDDPGDVRSEELLKGSAGAAGVELVLRLVQSVEKVDGGVPVHGRRRSEHLLGVRRCRLADALPQLPPLSHQRGIHDQVPERPDRGHVGGPEHTVWLPSGHGSRRSGPGPGRCA